MLNIRDYCTKKFVTLRRSDRVIEVIEAFLENQLDIACVVDDDYKLIGIVSKNALYRAQLKGMELHSSIEPLIRRKVVTVSHNDTFETVRDTLLEQKVAHGVVLDEDGRVFGVISKSNIISGFLQESEIFNSQLNDLIEHLQDAVVSINFEGKIVTFNRMAREIFGFEKDLVIGESIKRWFPELSSGLKKALQQQTTSTPTRIQIGKNTVIATFTPISHKKNVNGAMAILQDITTLESVAEELESTKNLQHKIHHALTMSYDAIMIVDSQGNITDINDAFLDLFNLKNIQIKGKHWSDVTPDLNVDNVLSGHVVEKDIRTIEGKTCFVIQEPIIRSTKTLGAITKIIYRQLDEWKDIFGRLEELESEVNFYKNELQRVSRQNNSFDIIISASSQMEKIKNQALLAAEGSSTVLVTGESGTGKELFAEAIHRESKRTGNYVKVNCAAIPSELLESEFFGYADGAFTGARRGGKKGKFELAHNGTLFLDEIGDMPLSLQAKLLRVLQEQTFERVGDVQSREVDVRIICATNKDLKELVSKGEFREDLYYRIDVVHIMIPPLRERLEDIPFLCDYLIKKLNKKMSKNVIGVTPETLAIIQEYEWPGNVRQLENVLERAMNMGVKQWIEPIHLPERLVKKEIKTIHSYISNKNELEQSRGRSLEMIEKQMIIDTLRKTDDNRSETARILGISRSGLYQKIRKYGIQKEVNFRSKGG